jgi:hypothetical protein
MQFDLIAIPIGSLIQSATLELNFYVENATPDHTVQVKSIDGTWDENTVTWANAPPYGNYSGNAIVVSGIGVKTWDLKDLVQQWVFGIRPNNGFCLYPTTTSPYCYIGYYLSEDANAATRPKLTIVYTPPSVTVQPDPATGKDTYISTYPMVPYTINNNHGSDIELYTGFYSGGYSFIPFFQFNLSSIPNGAIVTNSMLELYCEVENASHDIYRFGQ